MIYSIGVKLDTLTHTYRHIHSVDTCRHAHAPLPGHVTTWSIGYSKFPHLDVIWEFCFVLSMNLAFLQVKKPNQQKYSSVSSSVLTSHLRVFKPRTPTCWFTLICRKTWTHSLFKLIRWQPNVLFSQKINITFGSMALMTVTSISSILLQLLSKCISQNQPD